ncbi:hypothetical protein [Periweissella beninensis]|uniref:hypothetical protein n=1 Tax=Periweissella beninensis TaxID=504936 RepID=UPI001DC29DB7|nr:hypothetical protein [Periweissella beninensis]MBM7544914.1 hypothetical protein [Periweissella beninensis]
MNNQDFDLGTVKYFFEHDYHDRGMMKWQGFHLSDHTSALRKMDQDNNYNEKKLPQMTTDKIFHNAMHAVANYYTVTMQLDETNFNHETKKIYLGSLKTCRIIIFILKIEN